MKGDGTIAVWARALPQLSACCGPGNTAAAPIFENDPTAQAIILPHHLQMSDAAAFPDDRIPGLAVGRSRSRSGQSARAACLGVMHIPRRCVGACPSVFMRIGMIPRPDR